MEQINLNLIPNGILAVCHVSQYDNTGRKIRFHLFNGSDTYALSGTETITLRIRKTNGEILIFDIANTASDYIDLTVLQQMTDVSGDSVCEFRLADSNLDIGSFNFKMRVEPDAFDGNLSISEVSGPIATFETDLAEDLIKLDVDINPVQDLHGYDHPWVGGAGKNLIPLEKDYVGNTKIQHGVTVTVLENGTIKVDGTNNSGAQIDFRFYDTNPRLYVPNGTYTASITSTNRSLKMVISGSGNNGFTYKDIAAGSSGTSTVTDDTKAFNYIVVRVPNGVTCNNDIVSLQLQVGETATLWEPYSNICPITGWDEVNVTRTGKNLLDKSLLIDQVAWNVFTLQLKPNTTYTMSSNLPFQATTELACYFFSTSGNPSSSTLVYSGHSVKVTTLSDGLVKIQQRRIKGTDSFQNYNWQIELGSTPTDYEPYTGTEVTVQFGQTVYGGTINLTTGLLRITKGKVVLNGSESWIKSGAYSGGYFISAWAKANSIISDATHIQNILKTVHTLEEYGQTFYCCYFDNSLNIRVDNDLYPTVEDFKTWLSNNNVEVVYPLKTPIEIQLTPQQIEALVGTNVIWADTGDVEVKFYKSKNLEGGND